MITPRLDCRAVLSVPNLAFGNRTWFTGVSFWLNPGGNGTGSWAPTVRPWEKHSEKKFDLAAHSPLSRSIGVA